MAPPLDDTETPDFAPALPRAVREAAERADRLIAGQDPAPATTTVVEEAPAPETPPVVAPVVTPPAEDWEQKYRTLQGMYNTLNGEVPALRQQIDGLRDLIATLKTAPAPVVTPEVTPPVEIPTADADEYGEGLIAATRRWARAEVGAEVAELKRTVAAMSTKLAEVQGTTTNFVARAGRDATKQHLDADPVLGPQWRAINDNADFVAWLNRPDPLSGMQRLALVTDAYENGDGPRTARFFSSYLQEQTGQHQPPAPAPHTPPAPAVGEGGMDLVDLAAPGRGNAPPAAPGATESKRIWTGNEIAAFYRSVQKNEFREREAEKARIEQDILSAPAEGRIR